MEFNFEKNQILESAAQFYLNLTGRFVTFKRDIVAFVLPLVFFWYLQSYGTFSLRNFSSTGRSQYFYAQALSIIHFRWDVNPLYLEGWSGECLQYGGHCTGYYGIFPSIIRIPGALIFGWHHEFGSVYLLGSYAVFILGSLLFLKELYSRFLSYELDLFTYSIFVSLLTFSPVTFLAIRGYMYEEAILWGVGLLLLTIFFLLKYEKTGSLNWFACGLVSATGSLHSRVVEGVGAFVICILIWSITNRKSIRAMIGGLTAILFAGSSYLVINLLKFGVIAPSMRMHGGYLGNPTRLALVNRCGDLNLSRIPEELILYLVPHFKLWDISPTYSPGNYVFRFLSWQISNNCIENTEYFSPLPKLYPLLFCLGFFGALFWIRNNRNWVLGTICVGLGLNIIVICSSLGMTQRYLADIFPFFLVLSAYGLLNLRLLNKGKLWHIFCVLFLLIQFLTFYGSTISFWNHWRDRPNEYTNLPFAKNL